MSSLLVQTVERRTAAPAEARARVRSTCQGRLPDDLLTDLLLVVSELVTNAVRHGFGTIVMTVESAADEVLVTVADESSRLPRRVDAAVTSEGGRGLGLVERLALDWGARVRPEGGKVVWCRLSCAADQPA